MSVVCVVVEVKITLVAFKISVTIISLRVAFEIAAEFKTKNRFCYSDYGSECVWNLCVNSSECGVQSRAKNNISY